MPPAVLSNSDLSTFLDTTDVNDNSVMGQYGLHSCRSGDAAAVATTTSASTPEQAIAISTLTRGTIRQVERINKTCPGMTRSTS